MHTQYCVRKLQEKQETLLAAQMDVVKARDALQNAVVTGRQSPRLSPAVQPLPLPVAQAMVATQSMPMVPTGQSNWVYGDAAGVYDEPDPWDTVVSVDAPLLPEPVMAPPQRRRAGRSLSPRQPPMSSSYDRTMQGFVATPHRRMPSWMQGLLMPTRQYSNVNPAANSQVYF